MLINKIFFANSHNSLSGTNNHIKDTENQCCPNDESVETVDIPVETYKAYNKVSFKGRCCEDNDGELYLNTLKLMDATDDAETISTRDAVELLKPLNLTEKKILDYLMGCSFDSHEDNVVINKKAVLQSILLHLGQKSVPKTKIPMVIATSLDNENKTFSKAKFEFLFNPWGDLKLSKKNSLKAPRENNYGVNRQIALKHKALLLKEISASYSPAVEESNEIDYDDIFSVDLNKTKNEYIDQINKLDMPDDLKSKMLKELDKGNLDVKSIYMDYYSLLNDCKTLEEVKELYPDIKIPDFEFYNSENKIALGSRLAHEDMNRVGLDVLKNIYLNLKSPSDILINLDNSHPTTYISMKNAGFDFGSVPQNVKDFLAKSDNLINKFKNIDKLDEKQLEFCIRKNAVKTSRVWAEYMGVTNKYWHPVRAIAHKQRHPKTSYYQTDKLVDGYLFYLYKYKNQEIPSENPLEQFADGTKFNQEKKQALEKLYFLYRNNHNPEINSPEFVKFKENFDTDAMQKSVTKLERHYKNTFAKWFMTQARREKFEKAMDDSYNLVFEKMDLIKHMNTQKNTTNESIKDMSDEQLVEYIEETEDVADDSLENDFIRFKKIINKSGNRELKDLFMMYVGSDENSIDNENFLSFKPKIEESIKDNEIIAPEKLVVMFKINNMYMNYLFKETNPVSQEEYAEAILEKYRKTDGSIDYKVLNSDLNIQNEYSDLIVSSVDTDRSAFVDIINNKFVDNGKDDFATATGLLKMYDSLPEIFKQKFYAQAALSDRINNRIFVQQLEALYDRIDSWHLDKDEIITMDADKIPQNIVITSKAKYELLKDCNNNIDRFDTLLNKFFNAATKRIGDRQGQGVKVLSDNVKYAAELKIQGAQAVGSKRLYARIPTPEDIEKYGSVKYVFDTFDEHL